MNCYYSNLIEGHDTYPVDIERPRGEVDAIVGTGERQARRILASLVEARVVSSESPRGPLQLVFPAGLAGRWMPGLFPELAE